MEENKTLEDSFKELDAILEEMEKDSVAIEEAFVLYEKGMKPVKDVHSRLSGLEARIEKISEDGSIEEFSDDIS